MLKNKLIIPNKEIAKSLNVDEGSTVVYISRIRLANDEPVSIENNYFPLEYTFLLNETFDDNSLFEFLRNKNDKEVAISEKRIEICRATNMEAKILNANQDDPLLYIKSITYSRENNPIYVGTQIINDERFSLYIHKASGFSLDSVYNLSV